LLCTLAAGHQAWIKPSSKDRVLMEYICNQIKDIEPSTPICMYDETREYDAVIATGGNDANRYFESKFATTKRLCRTSRHSIAVLSENPTPHELDLLAEDIYSYSGLGCRNVSMIFAPRGAKVSFPSVATTLNYRDNYLRTKALLTIKGQEFEDNGTSILVRSHQEPSSLSMITIWEYDSLSEVEEWIAENDHFIQCIVCNNNIKHPRQVSFGEAQHPTLFDYADGVDTMIFLKLDN
ncbi:MAG: aldehyde dehydrogenase, partial [Rikenellaceae bacterium]